MPADLADSLKADEEDRKSDHATLVAAKEHEVATATETIETNLQQGPLCRGGQREGPSRREGGPLFQVTRRRPSGRARGAEATNSGADCC